jgi:XTP/dITP diphosphohydrolase
MIAHLVAIDPDGREVDAVGVLEGEVAKERRGTGGFGYDPVFVPEGQSKTVAELGDEWKRANSHRAHAAEALRAAIVSS